MTIDKCHKAWSVAASPKPAHDCDAALMGDAYITSLTRSQQRTLCAFSSGSHTAGKKLHKQQTILQLHTPTMKPINTASKMLLISKKCQSALIEMTLMT